MFNNTASKRKKFENKNDENTSNAHHSFEKENKTADYAFEVSSEGELEQINPVLSKVLKNGSLVELIYCSDSVEKQCQHLYLLYPQQLRILRLPLLTFIPFGKNYVGNWLTAKTFFLCRYDFFPELIFYGRKKDVQMILLAGTMKSYAKKSTNWLIKKYYKYVYNSFDKIIMSTDLDKEFAHKEFSLNDEKLESYDFRPIQIYKRIDNKEDQLKKLMPQFDEFISFLTSFEVSKRIIFGSYWNDENVLNTDLCNMIENGYQISLVPHKLDEESIDQVKESLNRLAPKLEIYEINMTMSKSELVQVYKDLKKQPGVLILNLKGILCELYTYYGHAYVAGGYRLSVHSLFEPFISECMVYCGPKITRSTEYDLIRQNNPDRIKIVENNENLLSTILATKSNELSSMDSFKSHQKGHFDPLLIWLGIKTNWGAVG